jgi:hypothetical protein
MKNSILTNRLTILVAFLSLLIAPKITAFSNAGDADAIVGVWKTGEGNATPFVWKAEGNLTSFINDIEHWITSNGYDLNKVKLITTQEKRRNINKVIFLLIFSISLL